MRDDVLEMYLRDTVNARELLPDGAYAPVPPGEGVPPFDVQAWFLTQHAAGTLSGVTDRLFPSAGSEVPGRKTAQRRNGHTRPPSADAQ